MIKIKKVFTQRAEYLLQAISLDPVSAERFLLRFEGCCMQLSR